MAVTSQAGGRFEIGRALNDTFSVVRRNLGVWAGLAIIFAAIPTLVLQFLILRPLGGVTDPETAMADPNLTMGNPWIIALSVLIPVVLGMLLTSALSRGTIEDLSGKHPSLGDCIATALSLFLPTLGISAVIALAIFVIALIGALIIFGLLAASSSPSVALIFLAWIVIAIPIAMLFLRWSVAVPALVQERAGVLGSLRRSAVLTKGSRWAILGLFVVVAIIAFVVQFVLAMAAALFGAIVGLVLMAIIQGLVSTLFSTAAAVTYVQLRQVKEGTSVGDLAEIFA